MKKTWILLPALALQQLAFSQDMDSTKKKALPVNITGSVDMYYRYNFNNPKAAPYNSLTSFTHSSNSFELGMASVKLDHNFGKVAVTADLGFGKKAEEFAYNDSETRLAIKQAFVSYAPSAAVKFTAGTWATHVGYELPDAYLNRNYSMSYMFSNGPFSHTGLKVDISLGGKTAVMVGISNPTDYRTAPGMPKSFIAQLSTGTKNDEFKIYLNLVAGKQSGYKKITQPDVVATWTVSSTFSIGVNGTWQFVQLDNDSTGHFNQYNWWGAALYLNIDPLSWLGFTLRNEYIQDKDNYLGLNHVWAPTLSANFKIDNLTIIPEFRLDRAGNPVFYHSASELEKDTGSFLLAAVYHF